MALPLTSGALRRRLRLRKGQVGRRSERASSFGKLRWLGRSRRLFPNVLRVGDVALSCACGKAILLTRCYRLAVFQFASRLSSSLYFKSSVSTLFTISVIVAHSASRIFLTSASSTSVISSVSNFQVC